VIVAEGYTDVIALHQAGVRNTVGLMGTALTEEQVAELARLAPVIQLALDADSAGREAMVRAARLAGGRRLELRVVPLPTGSDPADLVSAEGPEVVQRLIDASVPWVRFRVEQELARADLESAEGKDRLIDALRPVFATLAPSALREELLRLVADRTDLAPSLVSGWLAGSVGSPVDGTPVQSAAGAGDHRAGPGVARRAGQAPDHALALDAAMRRERGFLAQCIALPAAGRQALASIDFETAFTSNLARRAAAHLLEHLDAPGQGLPEGDEELTALIAELTVRAAEQGTSRAALDAERLKLELAHLERQVSAARASGGGDVAALAGRRSELQAAVDEAIGRAMAEAALGGRTAASPEQS
jgi:DNA primase